MSAPLALIAGGVSWPVVALSGLVCLTVCWGLGKIAVRQNKWLCAAQFLWIAAVLGNIAGWITESWPVENAYPAVPLVLLALGAGAAAGGAEKAARAGSALFWLLAIAYSITLLAGIDEVDVRLIKPAGMPDGRLILVFLIPALISLVPGRRQPTRWLVAVLGFAVAVSVVITGCLSSAVAETVPVPFYEWVRGLSLLGSVQRFEAVISVAVMMGWFALISFLLSTARDMMACVKPVCAKGSVWLCAALAGAFMLFADSVEVWHLVLGSVIAWLLIPAAAAVTSKIKNQKNFKMVLDKRRRE